MQSWSRSDIPGAGSPRPSFSCFWPSSLGRLSPIRASSGPSFWEYLFARPILAGLGLTIELTLIATVISLVAGTLLALMRMSANPVLSTVAAIYIWFFRSVPLLVQIIFFYNFSALYPHIEIGLPDFGPSFGTINVNAIISPFVAALLGLGFNESAYTAETVRGGILSVDAGQWAAAKSVGFSPSQTIRYVVLPQAIRVFSAALRQSGRQPAEADLTSQHSGPCRSALFRAADLCPDVRNHSAPDRRLNLVSRRRIHPLVLPDPVGTSDGGRSIAAQPSQKPKPVPW